MSVDDQNSTMQKTIFNEKIIREKSLLKTLIIYSNTVSITLNIVLFYFTSRQKNKCFSNVRDILMKDKQLIKVICRVDFLIN